MGGTSTFPGLTPVLPLGSLVYQGTVDNLLVSSTDADTYNLAIDPQQTLSVAGDARHVEPGARRSSLYSPSGKLLGQLTSSPPAPPVLFPAVQSSKGGNYQIVVTGGVGEYKVTATLNASLTRRPTAGCPTTSIATATPIDPYANKFVGNDTRTAVLGSIAGSSAERRRRTVGHLRYTPSWSTRPRATSLKTYTSPSFNGLALLRRRPGGRTTPSRIWAIRTATPVVIVTWT